MNPLGTQHVVECNNCNPQIINDVSALEKLVLESVMAAGLSYKQIIHQRFEPVGITVLVIINESHIALHTYPEANHVSIDVFTCSHPKKHLIFIDYLRKGLEAESWSMIELQRGKSTHIISDDKITANTSGNFNINYEISKKIHSTRISNVEVDVIKNEDFGKMFFVNKELIIAENDIDLIAKTLAECLQNNNATDIAYHGLFHPKFIKNQNNKIDVFVNSTETQQLVYKHFTNTNPAEINIYRLNEIENSDKRYDVIVSSEFLAHENFSDLSPEAFLESYLKNVHKQLKNNGVLILYGSLKYDSSKIKIIENNLQKHFQNINSKHIFVPSFCTEQIFYTATK